jgi:hypothetical protein
VLLLNEYFYLFCSLISPEAFGYTLVSRAMAEVTRKLRPLCSASQCRLATPCLSETGSPLGVEGEENFTGPVYVAVTIRTWRYQLRISGSLPAVLAQFSWFYSVSPDEFQDNTWKQTTPHTK